MQYRVEVIDEDTGLWEVASHARFDDVDAAIIEALQFYPEYRTQVLDTENIRAVWVDGQRTIA